MTKGIMAYIAVFALVLMVAMPAMALIAARNSVNRRSIIDGEVTYKDIGKGQVRNSELGPKSVRYGKIADGAVRSNHIKDGNVRNADLGSNAVNSAKIKDDSITNADIKDGSITNADINSGAAIADSKISYSTKIKHLHLAGAEFRPETSEDKFEINNLSGSLNATGTGSVFFYAPIHLPDGAEFTQVVISVWDNNANDINASLRWRYIGGTYAEIAAVSSNGSAANWKNFATSSINPSYKIIDNGGRSYFIRVELNGDAGANLQLGTVQIEYTIAEP